MLNDEIRAFCIKYIENMEFLILDLETHTLEEDYLPQGSGSHIKARVVRFPNPDVCGTLLIGFNSREAALHTARKRMESAKEILAGADLVANWIYEMYDLDAEIGAKLSHLIYNADITKSWRDLILTMAPNLDRGLLWGNLGNIFLACINMEDDYFAKLEPPYDCE